MNAAQLRINARIENEHWWFVGRRRILQSLLAEMLPPNPHTLIVDVGCGTGGNIGALAKPYRTIGIDTSPDAIELARERFPTTRFIRGRAPEDLGSAAREAKCFLLMDVLEHVPDDFQMLSSLWRAASPGAIFVLTVPANPALWSKHDESHLHYRRYEMERFRRLWAELPARELCVSYFNSRLYRPIQALRQISQWTGAARGEADTDLWTPARPVNRMLTSILASEQARLISLLKGETQRGYTRGVSLLAVLRRKQGSVADRGRPADVAADSFDPYRAIEARSRRHACELAEVGA